jgi:hypothetical protein
MKSLMPEGARHALPFQSINKKKEEMKQEVMKEAYELPRIAVRGIVLEEGMAEKASVLTVGTITQESDWGTDVVVKSQDDEYPGDYSWIDF